MAHCHQEWSSLGLRPINAAAHGSYGPLQTPLGRRSPSSIHQGERETFRSPPPLNAMIRYFCPRPQLLASVRSGTDIPKLDINTETYQVEADEFMEGDNGLGFVLEGDPVSSVNLSEVLHRHKLNANEVRLDT